MLLQPQSIGLAFLSPEESMVSGLSLNCAKYNNYYSNTMETSNLKNLAYTKLSEQIQLTPIQKFYSGANILITGGTGFLGKILIEKLLRSCPTLSTIYVLVRNKKGKNLHTRVDELFDDAIFERLRKECAKFRHKVVGVGGDCSLPDLGLNLEDRKTLIDEVSVIFHVAATVRFDEKMKMAVAINIRSPQDMLTLSRQMTNLKSFIHVSTAFSNCPNKVIKEKIYPSPIDSKKLILMTETMPDKLIDSITPTLLDKWPNTYAFTKQLAEDVIRQDGHGLPVGIFRPAIVVSTYREPIKAWINNLYGPTGVCAGAGTGVLRTLHCDSVVNANLVPVDMCVNSIIATAWEVGTTFQKCNDENQHFDIPVYNYESSNDQPINWGRFMNLAARYGVEWPSTKAIWYYSLTLQKTLIGYYITMFLLHTLPALFVDTVLFCIGKSPKMLKIYKKIHKFSSVISYFAVREWTFSNGNVRNLLNKMTEKDRELFFSDLKQLDWEEFFKYYLRGVRVYLIQDPVETLPEARVKWTRLYWAHQTTKVVLGFLLLRLAWSLISIVFSAIF